MERQFRALVVDDSPEDRTLISRALQHEGFVCEVANDGVMAENLLKSKVYDVVVTDLRMPRKHGHQLVVELLEQRNPPVIFVVTGLSEPKLVSDLLERGVADVVQKPLSYPTLAAKIKVLLKKKAGLPAGAESSAANRVASSIHSTAENLRQQLSLVTSSFQETIDQLETQRQQLEAGFLYSLRVLSNLISGQGKQSHVGRVEAMAECIGRQAGLEEGRMRHLKFAALLHDIGQFGMPDKLRNRPPWMLDE
ncbi:MAG: response regulator, partial [Candidatus Hydrogenedentes bacterium]|nr:response regulator [Candidatus Hydrogenedentota bacterium]